MPPIFSTRSRQNFSCVGFAGEDLVRRDAEPRQRRRLHRKRLRRPGLFAGDVARRHRPFLDGIDRLTGFALQKEHQARLRHRHHRGNSPPVADDVDERRRGGVVVVPDVVMGELKMPAHFAGVGIERDDRRAHTDSAARDGRRSTGPPADRSAGRSGHARCRPSRSPSSRACPQSSSSPSATSRIRAHPGAESCERSRRACRS